MKEFRISGIKPRSGRRSVTRRLKNICRVSNSLSSANPIVGVCELATAPTIAYYASTQPQAVWQAGGATALFIAGFGAFGYATRRDLSSVARACFFALIALIVFGIVAIFVRIPHSDLIYAIVGLVIFAGLTAFDFQRLRRSKDIRTAPLLAASIFLDALNVFLLFLSLLGNRN